MQSDEPSEVVQLSEEQKVTDEQNPLVPSDGQSINNRVSKKRRAFGVAAIAVLVAVCAEAVAMNVLDAVDMFS